MMKTAPSWKRSLILGLSITIGLIVFGYGFQVTKVNLAETRSERRQEQLVRILRALAHPDLFVYEKIEYEVNAPIWIDCSFKPAEIPAPDTSGPYMIVTPPCASPKGQVGVEGFNFEPYTRGPLNLIPPSGVTLQLDNIQADAEGHFEATVTLPNRAPVDAAQSIQAITRQNVGFPKLTQTTKDSWAKIIETVFMALLATTFGTLLAIPISFIAARNLMKEVTSPLASVAFAVIAWPLGIWAGITVEGWIGLLAQKFVSGPLVNFISLLVGAAVVYGLMRLALPEADEEIPTRLVKLGRTLLLLLTGLVGVLVLYLAKDLAIWLGNKLIVWLSFARFIGSFVASMADILGMVIKLAVALTGGALFGNLANRLGQILTARLSLQANKIINLPLTALAGAFVFALVGGTIELLYQLDDPAKTLWGPAVVGAAAGLFMAARLWKEDTLSFGLAMYFVARTILNTLRSIEPLIMVIVFAVWVGIGPFAGVLALALHTIAALAKLYSEQVESILPGPLEAVKAVGATRLQMIVYAVIPQIVPPYIAFTMYRWDINVRMSTIIGFAGGGGIGFLLQQNVNLLNYRAASVQMLFITIVVATLDYVSSSLRERLI